MRSTLSFVGCILLVAGCASSPASSTPEAPVERLTLRVHGDYRELSVQGARLWGPGHDVVFFEDGYRGQTRHGFLSLSAPREGRLGGIIGGGGFAELVVRATPEPDDLEVQGFWGPYPVHFRVDTKSFASSTGRCGYDLSRVAGAVPTYAGRTACGGHPVELVLPASFFHRPKDERAVMLSALLVP